MITLDFELAWGYIREPEKTSALKRDPRKGRGAVESLLALFEKYNVPATWATVGHLFLDKCQKDDGIPHKGMPRFKADWYSQSTCSDIGSAPLYYARDIVDKIMSSQVGHEIALHTFSHVPLADCDRRVAEAEIREGLKAAHKLGISPTSFVFPEDKIGHLDVLRENGFRIYRGKELAKTNRSQNTWFRTINRFLDRILAPPVHPKRAGGIWEIPSSTHFCDAPSLQFTLLPRCKLGIKRAIRSGQIFHLFLHPHNLVTYPNLLHKLDRLLAFVAEKRDSNKLQVMTMGKMAGYLSAHLNAA